MSSQNQTPAEKCQNSYHQNCMTDGRNHIENATDLATPAAEYDPNKPVTIDNLPRGAFHGPGGILNDPTADLSGNCEDCGADDGEQCDPECINYPNTKSSEAEITELITYVANLYYDLGKSQHPWSGKPGAEYPRRAKNLLVRARKEQAELDLMRVEQNINQAITLIKQDIARGSYE